MMVKKEKTIQETATTAEQDMFMGSTKSIDDLRTLLEEIHAYEGVIGYILRNSTSASIDIKDPTKIIDYAILSSSAFDAAEEFTELFDLGHINNIFVEGKNIKILSMSLGENRISIFMEKDADSEKILQKLNLS